MPNSSSQTPVIVALGASAGGLEAISDFLSHLECSPQDVTILVAQHLSPTYKSQLVELLSRQTDLKVVRAQHQQELLPGHVHVCPPDRDMLVEEDRIMLMEPGYPLGPKPSINRLFQSLALAAQERAIGVVLSGTGTDGAEGMRSIGEQGGLAIAQNPDTARYGSMPLAAIDTGAVSHVLSPGEIGKQLLSLIQNRPKSEEKEEDSTDHASDQYLQVVLEKLADHSGTDFTHYKRATFDRRLQRRMQAVGLSSLPRYTQYLKDSPEEVQALFQNLLIGVTSFFRDPEVFESLVPYLRQIWDRKSNGESLRVWVPGCASGEEAYTLAIVIAEIQREFPEKVLPVQILATDIDDHSIQKARQGVYPADLLESVPTHLRERYFQAVDQGYEVSKHLRSQILFSRHDLTTHPPFLKLDLVSCRNLLIYFDHHLQRQVVPLFHYALNPSGYLLLGKSETALGFTDLFAEKERSARIFQRRAVSSPPRMSFAQFRQGLVQAPSQPPKAASRPVSMSEMIKETLYHTFEHPYVVVNEAHNLLHLQGQLYPYLQLPMGAMTTQLFKAAHPSLQIEMRALLNQAIRTKAAVRGKPISVVEDDKTFWVELEVKPLVYARNEDELFMIIFAPSHIEVDVRELQRGEEEEDLRQRIRLLEDELQRSQEYLQTFVEELETSNEELQSLNEELQGANEELQSSNEELETTNEELQSTNEEVQIAYSELKEAHEQLTQQERSLQESRGNLKALLEHTVQGFILLDEGDQIKDFNSTAEEIFESLPVVSLRLHSHITQHFPQSQASALVAGLNQLKEQKKSKVNWSFRLKQQPRWFEVDLIPIWADKKQWRGVSLAMREVTEERRVQQDLGDREALITSIFNATSTGICVTDARGRFVQVNQGYCNVYGYTEEELIGEPFTKVVIPEFREAAMDLHDQFIEGAEEPPAEWQVLTKDGRLIDIYVTAQSLTNQDGSRFKVTTVRDITEAKRYRNLLAESQAAAKVGGWEIDAFTRQANWTQEVYRILGHSQKEELSLASLARFMVAEDHQQLTEAVETAFADGTPFDLELLFYYQAKQKKPRWVRFTCKPMWRNEAVFKLYGTIQDVSSLKFSQQELSKLSLVASKTHNGVAMLDTQQQVEWVNVGFETITGLELSSEQPLPFAEVLTHLGAEQAQRDSILQKLQRANPFREQLYLRQDPQQEFWVQLDFSPISDTSPVAPQFIVILTDISERVQADRMGQEAKQEIIRYFEINPDAVAVTDRDGTLLKYNPILQQWLEISEAELHQINITELAHLIHPDDRAKITELFQAIDHADAFPLEAEFRFMHQQRGERWIAWRAILDPERGLVYSTLRDVSRKKHEEKYLRMLEAVVVNANDSVLITEANTIERPGPRIEYVNEAFCGMTGYSKEEIIGKNPRILQGEGTDPKELARLRNALENWESCEVEVLNYHKNGSSFWVNFSVFPLADENGVYTHWVSIQRDVTERKEQAKQMARSQANLSALVNNTQDLVMSINLQGEVLTVNHAYQQHLKTYYDIEVNSGDYLLALLPEEHVPVWRKRMAQILRGKSYSKAEQEVSPDGQVSYFDVSVNPITTGSQIVGCTLFARDLTELLETQRKVEDLNQRLLLATRAAGIGVWEVQLNPEKLIWNAEMFRLYGRPANSTEINLAEWDEHIHPDDYAMAKRRIQRAMKQRQPMNAQFRIIRGDGSVRYMASYGVCQPEQGEVTGMIGVNFDITERTLAEQQIRQAKELAEEMNRLKSNFLAHMSHEIRTPLNGIMGLIPMLQREEDPKERAAIFEMLDLSGKRLLSTLTSILELARIEAAQTDYTLEKVDIDALVEEVFQSLRSVAHQRQLNYEFEPCKQRCIVPADQRLLAQIFLNLIGNALKFTSQGQVKVVVRREKQDQRNYVVVSIQDTGVGIDPAALDRIFLPFSQESEGQNRRFEGTGLGLAIAKRYTELLEGRIEVESRKGKGSTFTVLLPEWGGSPQLAATQEQSNGQE